MAQTVPQQLDLDKELAILMGASPSLNAMDRTSREEVFLRINMLSEEKKFEVRDMFLRERKDLAQASAKDMHEHYLKLKGIYETLKGISARVSGKVAHVKEAHEREHEVKALSDLERKLDDLSAS